MAKDPWAEFEEVTAPAPQRAGPRPILTVPDPEAALDVRSKEVGIASTVSGMENRESDDAFRSTQAIFDNTQKLQAAFNNQQPVKEYTAILPILIDGLRTPDDPTGDNALIYSYAKVMDPASVVRESEMGMASAGAPYWDSQVAYWKKQFGIEGGGALTPDQRRDLKRQINSRAAAMAQNYNQQRGRYEEDALAFNLDPVRVVGPHASTNFREEYRRLQGGQQSQAAPAAPALAPQPGQAPAPGGGDMVMAASQWGQGSGAREYTAQEQQAAYDFVRANPDITPERLSAWFYGQYGERLNNAPQVLDHFRKTGRLANSIDSETGYQKMIDDELARRVENGSMEAPGAMALATQGLSGQFGDEAAGVGEGISALLFGKDPIAAYQIGRDIERRRLELSREQSGALGTGAEVLGSAASFGTTLPGAVTTTGIRSAMKEAATGGAVTGFGGGEGVPDSITDTVTGGAVGAATAGIGTKLFEGIGKMLGKRAASPTATTARDTMAAADRQGIELMPADVGGTLTRRATAVASQLPLSANSVGAAAQRTVDQAQGAVERIAGSVGKAMEREAAGEAAATGAEAVIKRLTTKTNSLYSRARKMTEGVTVPLSNARQVLQKNIDELAETPGAVKGLEELQALSEELAGDFSVDGIKNMRSQLSDRFVKEGLRHSDLERRVMQVVDAAEDDVVAGLTAAGRPDAAKAWAEAAKSHREKVKLIDETIAPIIGKRGEKSGEEIMSAIDRLSKQNNARLGKFMSSLPADDAATVRATVITQLGKSNPGTQDAAGEAFSLGQFLTNWNKMSPGAKRTLFQGEARSALDDLAKVAEGAKAAQRFANTSNTGSVQGGIATGANVAGVFIEPVSSISLLAGQYGLGRLLASPRFARWLAKAPSNPGQMRTHVAALSKIASAESAIAADALGLQKLLMERFANAPGRAAAEPTTDQTAQPNTTTAGAPR